MVFINTKVKMIIKAIKGNKSVFLYVNNPKVYFSVLHQYHINSAIFVKAKFKFFSFNLLKKIS